MSLPLTVAAAELLVNVAQDDSPRPAAAARRLVERRNL
jgi:hypothetical protein